MDTEQGQGAGGETTQAAVQQAKEAGRGIFEEQKDMAVQRAHHVASALHDSAKRLHDEGETTAGDYADWAAGGLDRLTDRLARSDFDGMIRGVNDFARRQPALFLGGAVLVGLAVARMMKSSGKRHEGEPRVSDEPFMTPEVAGETGEGLEPPRRTESGLHARPEAEYGELESRKPGSPPPGGSSH